MREGKYMSEEPFILDFDENKHAVLDPDRLLLLLQEEHLFPF